MLSRGIDPLVLDPSKCHSHPDIPQEWPSRAQLMAYVEEARNDVLAAAGKAHDASSVHEMHALVMALEHERMHQETLCYMAAQQRKKEWIENTPTTESSSAQEIATNGSETSIDSTNLVSTSSSSSSALSTTSSPFYFNRCGYLASALSRHHTTTIPHNQGPSKMVFVPGGTISLGITPSENHGFVWDNELGTAGPYPVKDLQVASHSVTVAQFREFMVSDRGYHNPDLWEKADFEHFSAIKHTMPSTWSMDTTGEIHVHMPEGSFHWREVSQCPVYCSLAEATAYCKLHGGRVMTEPELVHVGNSTAGANDNNTNNSLSDLNSGGWEWTATPLEPFQGFKADPLYPEYSTDFFDGCHFVLRGSSPYTHPSMCRRSFRNYYQRQYPYMFAKFRIVKDLD